MDFIFCLLPSALGSLFSALCLLLFVLCPLLSALCLPQPPHHDPHHAPPPLPRPARPARPAGPGGRGPGLAGVAGLGLGGPVPPTGRRAGRTGGVRGLLRGLRRGRGADGPRLCAYVGRGLPVRPVGRGAAGLVVGDRRRGVGIPDRPACGAGSGATWDRRRSPVPGRRSRRGRSRGPGRAAAPAHAGRPVQRAELRAGADRHRLPGVPGRHGRRDAAGHGGLCPDRLDGRRRGPVGLGPWRWGAIVAATLAATLFLGRLAARALAGAGACAGGPTPSTPEEPPT